METIRNADVELPTENSWQDRIRSKVVAIRPVISERAGRMKPKMRDSWQRIASKANELRRNPAVIAGLAGAAGLALGLAGRWMRHRNHAPALMIVEV